MTQERTPSSSEATERIAVAKTILDEHATMALAATVDDAPWVGKAFFVEDEPEQGRFDMCCALLLSARKRDAFRSDPRIAFVVGGEVADRWLQGSGRVEILDQDGDGAAVLKRLADKAPQAAVFLEDVDAVPVRIHVERLKLTDLSASPPIAEFSFE